MASAMDVDERKHPDDDEGGHGAAANGSHGGSSNGGSGGGGGGGVASAAVRKLLEVLHECGLDLQAALASLHAAAADGEQQPSSSIPLGQTEQTDSGQRRAAGMAAPQQTHSDLFCALPAVPPSRTAHPVHFQLELERRLRALPKRELDRYGSSETRDSRGKSEANEQAGALRCIAGRLNRTVTVN
jgi:hypothetical protein